MVAVCCESTCIRGSVEVGVQLLQRSSVLNVFKVGQFDAIFVLFSKGHRP